MISYFWGTDREGARKAARGAFAAARKKDPGAPVFEFSGENVSLENLREVFSARPLTGGGVIVFFDHLTTNSTAANFITKNLAGFLASESQFIFWENELLAGAPAKEFKVSVATKSSNDRAEGVKLFAVADALGDRDRKRAWLLYHEALRGGAPAEEVFWKLVWKIKTLLLVATAATGSTLPLKPYPLSQARRQLKNYKLTELTRLSARLVKLYHEARQGRTDFDFAVERLLLEL